MSQPYGPSWPVTGIVLPLECLFDYLFWRNTFIVGLLLWYHSSRLTWLWPLLLTFMLLFLLPNLKFSIVDFGILSLDHTGRFKLLNLLLFYPKGLGFPTVLLKITVFWDVMPCNLVNRYHLFRGIWCLHIQGIRGVFIREDDGTMFLKNSTYLPNYTSCKIVIFIFTTMWTSNLNLAERFEHIVLILWHAFCNHETKWITVSVLHKIAEFSSHPIQCCPFFCKNINLGIQIFKWLEVIFMIKQYNVWKC
jgi:hypothetical protein